MKHNIAEKDGTVVGFTLYEYQKQFLHQIADACGVPRKYLT